MNYMQHEVDALKKLKKDKGEFMDENMAVALIRAAGLLPLDEELDWSSFNFSQRKQLIALVKMAESAAVANLLKSVQELVEMEDAVEQVALIQQQGASLS
tara:strand:- start:213 stop:512 length:300 start_codon:yes stop_codon:yes gene_type:complete